MAQMMPDTSFRPVFIIITYDLTHPVKNTEIGRNSGAKWSAGTSERDGAWRSSAECDGGAECDGRGLNLCVVPSLWRTWCPLIFGARWSKSRARWSKVEESGAMWESSEQCGKVRSNVEKCRQIWRGLEQPGEVWSKMEESGAARESSEQVQSNVEECREIWKGLEMLGAKCGERICVLFRLQTGVLPWGS